MAVSTPAQLVRELERVSHDERMRRMVELGRRAEREPDVAALLERLERGDTYQRLLAHQSVYGGRSEAASARAARALRDPSGSLRKRAVHPAALVCTDAHLAEALPAAPREVRQRLVRELKRRGRLAPLDAFLEALAAQNDPDFERLYAYGSAAFVERHALRGLDAAGVDDWRRLARHHPTLAAQRLAHDAAGLETVEYPLLWRANAALQELSRTVPDQALEVVRAFERTTSLASLTLQPLVAYRPAALADLVAESEDAPRVVFDSVAHRLDQARRARLMLKHPSALGDISRWFRRLPPAERLELYRGHGMGLRGASGADNALPTWLVAALPAAERLREARRHLSLPMLMGEPAKRLPYAAFLPWEEALSFLQPFLRNPEAGHRALAVTTLAGALRFQRDRAPDLLALIRARHNEQDPVRVAMLRGLASLPPSTWRPEHLDDLGLVIRHALDAADLSTATAGAAEALVIHLLPFHPEWAARWVATLVGERGQIHFHDLERHVDDAAMRRLAPALVPVLRSWETREREAHLITAAQGFGRRLPVFRELVDILANLTRESKLPHTAERALEVLRREVPERFGELVPELIRRDKSWATRRSIYEHLHRRRQDLLTPFLGRRAYRGRFATGKTRFVLPVVGGFLRWTPAQQRTFAQTLHDLTGDAERDSPAVIHATRQLAALPQGPIDRLAELAALSAEGDQERPAVRVRRGASPPPTRLAIRDTALRALANRDSGDGVPALIAALGDERARIAIYALRRALLALPPDEALERLRRVPVERVTVAKEVARLLGDLRSEGGYRELLAWSARELHRDVRVAVIRGLWPHADRDEAWEVFDRAAASPDEAIASVAGRLPADGLSPTAQRRLARLLARLLTHGNAEVRLDALRRCATLPVADPERVIRDPLVRALSASLPGEQGMAAVALFATYAGRESGVVAEAVRGLLSNRRALVNVVDALRTALRGDRRHLRPTGEAVLAELARDPLTGALRARLCVATLSGETLARALAQLAADGALHADALAAAVEALGSSATPERLYGLTGHLGPFGSHGAFGPWGSRRGRRRGAYGAYARPDAYRPSFGYLAFRDHSEVEPDALERSLAQSGDERLRRIALAALEVQAADSRGWTSERLARLRAFREDPSPLVAAAAQFTLPLAELEGEDDAAPAEGLEATQ